MIMAMEAASSAPANNQNKLLKKAVTIESSRLFNVP